MKPSDSNWLRTMFHIVGLEYPCFDTDLISMCSRITAPVWASCVWLLHSSHSRDPPSPSVPARSQRGDGEEMWSVCSVWTRLAFCDRPHKCEKLQAPPGFIQDCPPTGAHHWGNLANMWSALECASPNAEGGRAPPRPRFSKGGADVDAAPLREEFTLLLFI